MLPRPPRFRLNQRWLAVCLLSLAGSLACTSRPSPPPERIAMWRAIGTWKGRGNMQTESFSSDSGALRVRWQTTNETAPGAGRFRLTSHSAISGRALRTGVDYQGVGEGTADLSDDPRVFFIEVESSDVDWTFTVEEALLGTVSSGRP